MKKFNITVNGNAYEVEIEEVKAAAPVAAAPKAAPAAAAPAPKAAPAAAAAAPAAGDNTVTAPMPGKIVKLVASVGQAVNAGDVLLILEAMKMENEIVAPQDGTVASINVSKSDSVEAGQVIITLN